jgi:CRP-like cAMP-binding protein
MVSRRLDVVSYLGSQVLFQNMSEAELQRIAAASCVRRVQRGTEIFAAGDDCEDLYLVVDGLVKLYAKGPNGHEKIIEVVGAGGCVTEALLFNDQPHSVNASALADVQMVEVPKDVLMTELNRSPEMALRFITDLSRRFAGLVRDIEALTLHSGIKRVVDYLVHSPDVGQVPVSQRDATVSLPASKGTIASLLSVTPEHFSRILHELQANGLIAVNRRQIHIPDVQRLACYG